MDRIDLWVDQDKMLDSQRRRYLEMRPSASDYEMNLLTLEAVGGDCGQCGLTWTPVRVENMHASYTYYRPSCSCDRVREVKHWILTCKGCGVSVAHHDGEYHEHVCPDCNRQNKKSKRDQMNIERL